MSHADNGINKIDYRGESWAADVDNREFDCNQWNISGIPRVHEIATI